MRDEKVEPEHRLRSMATGWRVYVALTLLVLAGAVMVFGFDGEMFKPATGSARAMALSAD